MLSKLVGPKDLLARDYGQEINATVSASKTTVFDITGGETTWTGLLQKVWKKIGIMQ